MLKSPIILCIVIYVLLFNTVNSSVHYHQLNLWSSKNCTGDLLEFLLIGANEVHSVLVNRVFYCNQFACNYTNLPIEQTLENNFSKISTVEVGGCNNHVELKYIKEDEFDYDESEYCVISEYSTNDCKYKPIFHMGILIKKKVCIFGIALECSALKYSVQNCKSYSLEDPTNFTISVNQETEQIATYTCYDRINIGENYSISYKRGYIVHAGRIDGVDDPIEDRIKKFVSSPSSSSSSSSLKNHIYTMFITTIIIVFVF